MNAQNAQDPSCLSVFLSYDRDTGLLTWEPRQLTNRCSGRFERIWNSQNAGHVVTYKNSHGYILCSIRGKRYFAHRVAWAITTGQWPVADIDHINGDRDDNRWQNLREATRTQNQQNRVPAKGTKSGLKGAHYYVSGQKHWMANIKIDGKQKRIGYFYTADEAHAAYEKAARENFGTFARVS